MPKNENLAIDPERLNEIFPLVSNLMMEHDLKTITITRERGKENSKFKWIFKEYKTKKKKS